MELNFVHCGAQSLFMVNGTLNYRLGLASALEWPKEDCNTSVFMPSCEYVYVCVHTQTHTRTPTQ